MGNCNTHVFFHRVPALATASLASFALGFSISAGLICEFVRVLPQTGEFLEYTSAEGIQVELELSSIGMVCERPPLFQSDGDVMWTTSRVFWYAALGIGGLASVLSWLLTTVVAPSTRNWKILSILSAVTAVVQVPVFLLFESQPCVKHTCRLDTGCYLLIMSTVFWTTVTFLTQCLDPPLWAEELDAWRVRKHEQVTENDDDTRKRMWQRWKRRRQWASRRDGLALAITESVSNNEDEATEDLLEKGSYYAHSNNSRLLLNVRDGRRPGDDQKSVTTFGDLDDFVKLAEEEHHHHGVSLLGEPEFPDDEVEDTNLFSNQSLDEMPVAKEVMIIHSHEDGPVQYYSNPDAFPDSNESNPKGGLLLNGQDVVEADKSQSSPDKHSPSAKLTAGIRALTSRIRRDTKRTRCGRCYSAMDEGSDSSEEDREALYSPPMSTEPMDSDALTDTDPRNQKLLNDWTALHAAATAGILLPTAQPNAVPDDSGEDDPEPVYYSSEDSAGITLQSFGHRPEEAVEEEDLSSMSESSDDERNPAADSEEVQPNRRGRSRQRRRMYSSAASVGSRRSLLDTTIDEETDIDLLECETSGEEDKKGDRGHRSSGKGKLLNRSKSVPPEPTLTPTEPYRLTESRSFQHKPVSESDEQSETSREIENMLQLAVQRRVTPVTDYETSSSEGPSSALSPLSSSSSIGGKENHAGRAGYDATRRCRSMSLPKRSRRTVYPLAAKRGKSAAPKLRRHRQERVFEAGIHSAAINIVSDESSNSDRSARSSAKLAREARIQRLTEEKRRRARTLDPPKNRRVRIVETSLNAILLDGTLEDARAPLDFDPTISTSHPDKDTDVHQNLLDPSLAAIMKLRGDGAEYGPDEMSL